MSSSSPSTPTSATPQQIGKAFVVQYYRLLHEHPESLHRFYSTSSTFMHDDHQKTAKGIEEISKRIEELSFKQRHVKIRQVDCHSTVGSSVVVQVCGEISSSSVIDSQTQPIMKRFVQTFVLTPADNSKQKYYVHNDIFRYQDSPTPTSTTENIKTTPEASASSSTVIETPITPSASSTIEFYDNTVAEKKEGKSEANVSSTVPKTPPATPAVADPTKEQPSKPKSYRDAIGKKEKSTAAAPQPPANTTATTTATAAAATATENQSTASTKKSNKQQKKAAAKANANSNRNQRGHPQDANDYYDDSWYHENEGVEGYLSTGYTDDQEIFVGNLSAQVTENEIHGLFRPYGSLLLVRIGNTGSQVGAANFAFVVCQSIEMAKAIVADHETFLKTHQVNVEAKKRRPFPHTFRPTYPTAASPTSYQSTGYPAALYNQSSYYEGVPTRGVRRGGRGGAK